MRGRRPEPVGVLLQHGRPVRFVWRGRLYAVLLVLDRRVLPTAPIPTPPGGPSAAADDQSSGQEVWLVEATPQPAVAAARYELSRDLATGQWTLSRA